MVDDVQKMTNDIFQGQWTLLFLRKETVAWSEFSCMEDSVMPTRGSCLNTLCSMRGGLNSVACPIPGPTPIEGRGIISAILTVC